MHIVADLNLWGDAVANMVFFGLFEIFTIVKAKHVPAINLRLFRHVMSILSLKLILVKCLKANLRILA